MAELQVVVLAVAGSSPVDHPTLSSAQIIDVITRPSSGFLDSRWLVTLEFYFVFRLGASHMEAAWVW